MADTIIDNASVHEIAAWRRAGEGVWFFLFVVEGYDENFVMREPGRLSEGFGQKLAAKKWAKALGVRRKYVIHKQTVKEP
jgi:hypothetical protein